MQGPAQYLADQDHRDASQAPPRLLYLDGWRGLAIISVLVGHFLSVYLPPLFVLGGYGVTLFFVLSGRLMADILFVQRQPLPLFLQRRAARILPTLIVFVNVMAVYSVIWFTWRGFVVMRPWEYLAALTFTINYVQALGDGLESRYLAHLWSLCVEEHCYIILAMIAFFGSRNRAAAKWLLTALACASLVRAIPLWLNNPDGVHAIYWRTEVSAAPLMLSAALRLWIQEKSLDDPRVARLLGAASPWVLGCSLVLFFASPNILRYTLGPVLLALAVNGVDTAPAGFKKCLAHPVLQSFGILSYSLYLWQQPIMRYGWRIPSIVLLLAAIGMGVISYLAIERPARRFLNRNALARRSRRTSPEGG
jgi:peptidoglycan/LPS O-acetylase OafA/YrhL